MFNFLGLAGVAAIATLRILIFVAIITFFIKQYKQLGGGRSSALKMLDEKYVNDEISDKDYKYKKSILTQK